MTRRYRHHRRIPSYVWGWLAVLALAIALFFLPSCKVQQHATHQSDAHTESKHLMVYDTTYLVEHVVTYDTNYVTIKSEGKEHIVEEYDKETGNLTKRITDRETSDEMQQRQLNSHEQRLEKLEASMKENKSDKSDTHEEDESHKESESKTPWTGIIAAAILGSIFAGWLLWKAYKFL